jgi:serine/threonine protein kinase
VVQVDRLQADDPSQIGPYRLLGRLGEGGMGQVFLGASPGGRKVAIKVVRPRYANDPEFRRRFAREVDAARQVGGFHTAAVVGADPDADPPWMATAYIPGPSLTEALAQRGPLDEAGVRDLGAALAEGLAAIHACGLIHRDLKPSNVILADDGPRIIDFGIAKGADATDLTGANAVIGTLRHMSPEQLHGRELTPHSDVFALGTILAYAATGHDPFGAPAIPAVITRILNDLPSLDPLTGDLRDIISDCLAKDPGGRPSLDDLMARFSPQGPSPARAIEPEPATRAPSPGRTIDVGVAGQHQRAMPPAARTGDAYAPAARTQRLRHRRRAALAAIGTTAAVGLAALGAVTLGNHQASTPPPGGRHSGNSSSQSQARLAASLSATGSLVRALTDPASQNIWSIALSPDGTTLATGDGNGRTYLWNIASAKITATFTTTPAITPAGAANGVFSVAFAPNGKILAIGDNYGHAYLCNVATGTITATLTDPASQQGVRSVAFAPDGTTLAASDGNGHAYLWNTTTGKLTATLTYPAGEGYAPAAFAPNGTTLVTSVGGRTYLWNTSTSKVTATLTDRTSQGGEAVAFSPDGTILAVGSVGYTYLWNIATGKVMATLADPTGSGIGSVAFAPDGTTLATGDDNGRTYLWNTATGKITATLTDTASQGITSVAFTRDGSILAVGDGSGTTYLWYITYHKPA